MASRPIPSWFNNLPSWIQSGRTSYYDDDKSRVSSLVSASTRTKRKSRAEAMRRLEGRKLSEPTTIASTRGQDSESEDDDPWTDPWQWQRPPARRSSSVYSDTQELHGVHKYLDEHTQNPFIEEEYANTKKPDSPKHSKNPFNEDDHSALDQKHDLELQVRAALRQSHSTAGNSELTHPPKAYSVLSERFSLTPSDSPYRLSWLHTASDQDDGVQKTWRGASRSYDPDSWRGMNDDVKALGWNWTRSISVGELKSLSQSTTDSKPSSWSKQSGSERGVVKDSLATEASTRPAWLHILAAFLVVFNTWGLVCAFGAFKSYYGQVLLPNTSQSSLSWIGSTQLAMLFFAMVPCGQLVDRGYFRFVFLAGTTFLVTGIFSVRWCSALATIWLTQGLIAGVGIGMIFGSASALAMQQYEKVATRLQLPVLGAPIGGLCYVLLARKLMASYGPRTAMPIMAMVITLTMVLPLVVLSEATSPSSISLDRPGNGNHIEDSKRRKRVGSTLNLALVASGLFFTSLGAYFGLFHLGSGGLLLPQESASPKLLIAALIASIPGCLLLAVIGRHVAVLQYSAAITLLNSCVMWLWIALTHVHGTSMVVACLYGMLIPGIPMLCMSAVYNLCQEPATKVDRELLKAKSSDVAWAFRPYGGRACVLFFCVGIACLVGSPACGALVDSAIERESLQTPYLAAQAFAGSALSIGGILLLGAAITERIRGSRVQTKEDSQAE